LKNCKTKDMKINRRSVLALFIGLVTGLTSLSAQTVPAGINYQAVARDNTGKELANTSINVKFSILKDSPLGSPVYEELHSNVVTTKYGVFSLIIGNGAVTGGTAANLNAIDWSTGTYYLSVAVKFDNSYLEMGTMQFMAVPYALYAAKSLEPGPQGPKGDQGDPATDDQTLSFDGSALSIAGGNIVDLSGLLQSLTITNAADGNYIGISRGNSIKVSTIEGDGDPTNEIQDLVINNNVLKITKNTGATSWDLSKYLDNTDSQSLSYNSTSNVLGISGSTPTVDLSALKQSLTYNESTKSLSISSGNSVTLGTFTGFKAGLSSTMITFSSPTTPVDLVFTQVTGNYFNDGNYFNTTTGAFTAPYTGVYTFNYNLYLPYGSYIIVKVGGAQYDTVLGPIATKGTFNGSFIIKLSTGDTVNLSVLNGDLPSGTVYGSFSGYRVN